MHEDKNYLDEIQKKTYARVYIMRQNMNRGLLTYKHQAYVKKIYGSRCWIACIIYEYFYLIEDAYALVEIIYICTNSCQRKGNFTYIWLDF